MLYVVGDSNAKYTSRYLLANDVDAHSMCAIGRTSQEVLESVLRKRDLSDATAFFVFVGMNDALTGEGIAANIAQIVSVLRVRRPSARVPIFLATPFCVRDSSSSSTCDHRREAARLVTRELDLDAFGTTIVDAHVTRDVYVKRNFETFKPSSNRVDPLHLNASGYMAVATSVNKVLVTHTTDARRGHKPKRHYEAGPAPSPKVLWAEERRKKR